MIMEIIYLDWWRATNPMKELYDKAMKLKKPIQSYRPVLSLINNSIPLIYNC